MMLNFRADRARQIMAAIGDQEFSAFATDNRPKLSTIVGMNRIFTTSQSIMGAIFPDQELKNTLGQWLGRQRAGTIFALPRLKNTPMSPFL